MTDWKTRAERAEAALGELVTLKDGPRDAEYERRKPLAWQAAREVLAAVQPDYRTRHADDPGLVEDIDRVKAELLAEDAQPEAPCPTCEGSGSGPGLCRAICKTCGGDGTVKPDHPTGGPR